VSAHGHRPASIDIIFWILPNTPGPLMLKPYYQAKRVLTTIQTCVDDRWIKPYARYGN